MISIKIYMLFVSCLLAWYLFVIIYKADERVCECQQTSLVLEVGQIVSFVIGILLYLVFPMKYSVSGAINIWIGAIIGMLFCSVKESQSFAGGFFCGGLAAIMGTMVSASAINPAICGLPVSTLRIQNPDLAVGAFGLVLLSVTVLFVKSSLKN